VARKELKAEIVKLSDLQASDFLLQLDKEEIASESKGFKKKFDELTKYSELDKIKTEIKNVKTEISTVESIISDNNSNYNWLQSTIEETKSYLENKNISKENKIKLETLIKPVEEIFEDRAFDKMLKDNPELEALTNANEVVQKQINQTEADNERKTQHTLDVQKTAGELLKDKYTSESDKTLINEGLNSIKTAASQGDVVSAVNSLQTTLETVQSHNKEAKAEADKKAAEAQKEADKKKKIETAISDVNVVAGVELVTGYEVRDSGAVYFQLNPNLLAVNDTQLLALLNSINRAIYIDIESQGFNIDRKSVV
jgi:hypothetical protein